MFMGVLVIVMNVSMVSSLKNVSGVLFVVFSLVFMRFMNGLILF